MNALVDFSKLPAPDVIEELNFETIFAERKARLLELTPESDRAATAATLELESEPVVKLIQENAYRELGLRQRVNEAGTANMLPYAKQNDLENLAANFQVERLTVVAADPDASPPVEAVMEDDDSLLERTQNAFEGLSTAGPTKSYEFHARSADGRVADASCQSPAPCDILITVLGNTEDGSVPEDVLAIVMKALSDEDVRPVGDRVTVQAASVELYDMVAELIVKDGAPENALAPPAAQKAAGTYVANHRKLATSVYRSKIDGVLGVEGVVAVRLLQPGADIIRNKSQAAICRSITLTVRDESEVLSEQEAGE